MSIKNNYVNFHLIFQTSPHFSTHNKNLNSAKIANLKATFVTYTTVAVILVLDVRVWGQLETTLFQVTKIS